MMHKKPSYCTKKDAVNECLPIFNVPIAHEQQQCQYC